MRRFLAALLEIVRRALPWDDERIGGRYVVDRRRLERALPSWLLMQAINRSTLGVPEGVGMAVDGAEIRRRLVDGILAELERLPSLNADREAYQAGYDRGRVDALAKAIRDAGGVDP